MIAALFTVGAIVFVIAIFIAYHRGYTAGEIHGYHQGYHDIEDELTKALQDDGSFEAEVRELIGRTYPEN